MINMNMTKVNNIEEVKQTKNSCFYEEKTDTMYLHSQRGFGTCVAWSEGNILPVWELI